MTKNSMIKDRLNWFMAKYSNVKGVCRRFVWLLSILLLGGCVGTRTMNGMGVDYSLVSQRNTSQEVAELRSKFREERLQDNVKNNANNAPTVPVESSSGSKRQCSVSVVDEKVSSSSTSSSIFNYVTHQNVFTAVAGSGSFLLGPAAYGPSIVLALAASNATHWGFSERGVELLKPVFRSLWEGVKDNKKVVLCTAGVVGAGLTVGPSAWKLVSGSAWELVSGKVWELVSGKVSDKSLTEQDCAWIGKAFRFMNVHEKNSFLEYARALQRIGGLNVMQVFKICEPYWSEESGQYVTFDDTGLALRNQN